MCVLVNRSRVTYLNRGSSQQTGKQNSFPSRCSIGGGAKSREMNSKIARAHFSRRADERNLRNPSAMFSLHSPSLLAYPPTVGYDNPKEGRDRPPRWCALTSQNNDATIIVNRRVLR